MTTKRINRTAALLAAAGLSAISPMQTGAVLLATSASLWAGPALATERNSISNIRFVPTALVSKSKSNVKHNIIFAPSDANGEVRITGLEPGDYEVQPILICCLLPGEPRPKQSIRVGQDGRLAYVVKGRNVRPAPNERQSGPHVRHYVEAIPFGGSGVASAAAAASSGRISATTTVGKQRANSVIFDMRQTFSTIMPPPCDPLPGRPDTCNRTPQRNHIDVNASSAAEITRLAPETSPAAAEALIAERTRGGAFKNVQDFASRVCTKTSIDFGDAPVRMGNASILVKRGGEPKANGFKCAVGKDGGEPDVSIINTLLTAWLIWYISSQ